MSPSSPPLASDDPCSDPAEGVEYRETSNTIVVRQGATVTLPHLACQLARPDLLRESAPGEWLLGANLLIEGGADVRVAGPEVTWLKLHSGEERFVWVKAVGGTLAFADTRVTSWDPALGQIDESPADGRSFVLAREGGRLTIHRSEMSYLGYGADESYGVAWRLAGTAGEAIDSVFSHNYYGLYSYEVSGLVIRGNEVHHNVLYGIDPHTRSNDLVIEDNDAHHNGKHGIILAEECQNSIVRNNRSYGNTLHGIVLFGASNHNRVEGNESYENGHQGINVNGSSSNLIRDNLSHDNGLAGIGVGQRSTNNVVQANLVSGNGEDGIYLYSQASGNVLQDNVVRENGRYGIYVKSRHNVIAGGNEVWGNQIGVYLNVEPPPTLSLEENAVYDNQEANVRRSSP